MQKDIKLVICDIDWTLLSRQKRVLDEYTLQVFKKLHDQGVMFGVASGRPIDEVVKCLNSWKMGFEADVIISMNGGELTDNKAEKFYEYYKLKKEWIRDICELVEPLNVNPYMYYHGAIKSLHDDEWIRGSAIRNEKELIVAKDLDDFCDEDNGKIMIRQWDEKLMEVMYNHVAAHPSKDWAYFKTQASLLEFADSRISKGNALKEYCRITGLDLDKVVAFGDTTNDNDMIEASGWGVCLLNGSDDTKQIADDITEVDVEQDGVAHYLAKHFLGEE